MNIITSPIEYKLERYLPYLKDKVATLAERSAGVLCKDLSIPSGRITNIDFILEYPDKDTVRHFLYLNAD